MITAHFSPMRSERAWPHGDVFKLRPKDWEKDRYADLLGRSGPRKGNGRHKGPGAGKSQLLGGVSKT